MKTKAFLLAPFLAFLTLSPVAHAEHLEKGVEESFMKLDSNGDGKISYEEFVTPNRLKFSDMDADHDGFLSETESHDFLRGALADAAKQHGKTGAVSDADVSSYYRSLDTNKDGKISLDDFIFGARNNFQEMDVNNDGYLSRKELWFVQKELKKLISLQHSLLKKGASPEAAAQKVQVLLIESQAARAVFSLDANEDNKLSSAEYLSLYSQAFKNLDLDENGKVSKQEILENYRMVREAEGQKETTPDSDMAVAEDFIRSLDLDGDGSVDFAEYTRGARAEFDEADLNKDGFVTAVELVKWKKAQNKQFAQTHFRKK